MATLLDIKTSLLNHVVNGDVERDAVKFIQNAQRTLEDRFLVPGMEKTLSGTLLQDVNLIPIPSDYLNLVYLRLIDEGSGSPHYRMLSKFSEVEYAEWGLHKRPSSVWSQNISVALGDFIIPITNTTGLAYEATTPGVTGTAQPVWPNVAGGIIGSGSGCIVTTVGAGALASATPTTPGTGYFVGEILVISGGGGNATFSVATLNGTGVGSLALVNGGSGYAGAAGVATTAQDTAQFTAVTKLNPGFPHSYERFDLNWMANCPAMKSYIYNIRYHANLSKLVADSDTNWWTLNRDELLLYGALVKSIPFLGDEPRAQEWEKAYAILSAEFRTTLGRERFSGDKRRSSSVLDVYH